MVADDIRLVVKDDTGHDCCDDQEDDDDQTKNSTGILLIAAPEFTELSTFCSLLLYIRT